MSLSDFSGPFIIAVIVHALVFSAGSMNNDPAIVPQKGAASVTLNMVTSAARRSQTLPNIAVPDVSGHTTKIATQKESVRPISEPPQTPRVSTTPPEGDATAPHEKSVLAEENSSQQAKPETEQIVAIEEDVMGSPLMLQKQAPVDVGAALGTSDNEGDVGKQGVRVPAAAVGLVKPVYPRFSRIHGEEGTVVLSVTILADGRTGKIEIVSSSGFRRLNQAALKAIGAVRFIAARIDGRSVDSEKCIAFRFDLDD